MTCACWSVQNGVVLNLPAQTSIHLGLLARLGVTPVPSGREECCTLSPLDKASVACRLNRQVCYRSSHQVMVIYISSAGNSISKSAAHQVGVPGEARCGENIDGQLRKALGGLRVPCSKQQECIALAAI